MKSLNKALKELNITTIKNHFALNLLVKDGKITGYQAVKYSHRNKNMPEIKKEDIQKRH